MLRAAIYTRISNDPDHREAGVQRQEDDCRALAERYGYQVGAVFSDNDVSASTRSTKHRPAYEDMIRRAEGEEFGAILSYSTSRLTRRPAEWERLIRLAEQHNVLFRTVVSGDADFSTADGRAVARTLAAWDGAEAERTGERVARAKLEIARRGGYRGGSRPFGYEADGLTVREDEAAALRRAAEGVVAGRTLWSLAGEMADAGFTSTAGNPMTVQKLGPLLKRPRNAGLMEVKGEVTGPAQWPAIVPEDTWRACCAVLADPSRRPKAGPKVAHLGTGLFVCGMCGSGLKADQGQYRCRAGRPERRGQRGERHVSRNESAVDKLVRGAVATFLRRELADVPLHHADDARVTQLRQQDATLRARLQGFERDYSEGLVTGRQLADATARVQAELDQIADAMAGEMRGSALAGLAGTEDPGAAFLSAPVEVQRGIIRELVDVVVHPSRRGRPKGWRPGQPYVDLETVELRWKQA